MGAASSWSMRDHRQDAIHQHEKKERYVRAPTSSNSESLSSSSPSVSSPLSAGRSSRFFETRSNFLNFAFAPMVTPSATRQPRGTRARSPSVTHAPTMLPSTIVPAPTCVSSNMYASRKTAPGPIVQRWPMTEAFMEACAEITVCEPMSVLLPILHVLYGRKGKKGGVHGE